jgi:hypothetical protein
MRWFIIALALLTAGCASASVDGTELGGVATWTVDPTPTRAIAAANAHCQKYGRIAKTTQVNPLGYLTFSCERP